jgi:hypothetical protein
MKLLEHSGKSISSALSMARYNLMVLAVLSTCAGLQVSAQVVSPQLKGALSTLKFTPKEFSAVEAGRPAAIVVDTGNAEDMFIVGAIQIGASPAEFVSRYRDIIEFESGPGVKGAGKFSTPPNAKDLTGFSLTKDDIDDIRDCKPGDCMFKISDAGMQRIRNSVDWKSAGYVAEANNLIRAMWLEYLQRYQKDGNKALLVYHDSQKYSNIYEGLNKMVKDLPVLQQYMPEMASYILQAPQGRPQSSEEFYYWQAADFGMKVVQRVTHVTIEKKPTPAGDGYLIANKMLYASHYFRSALELRFLIPIVAPDKKPATILVVLQRSYVDGMTGLKGKMLHSIVVPKSRESLERYLVSSKNKLEGNPSPAK